MVCSNGSEESFKWIYLQNKCTGQPYTLQELRRELNEHLQAENYCAAAVVRDEIRRIEASVGRTHTQNGNY